MEKDNQLESNVEQAHKNMYIGLYVEALKNYDNVITILQDKITSSKDNVELQAGYENLLKQFTEESDLIRIYFQAIKTGKTDPCGKIQPKQDQQSVKDELIKNLQRQLHDSNDKVLELEKSIIKLKKSNTKLEKEILANDANFLKVKSRSLSKNSRPPTPDRRKRPIPDHLKYGKKEGSKAAIKKRKKNHIMTMFILKAMGQIKNLYNILKKKLLIIIQTYLLMILQNQTESKKSCLKQSFIP